MNRRGCDRHHKGMCAGKLRYRTMNEAEMEIERARDCRGEELRAYDCPRCGNIHLTSWPVDRQERQSVGVS